MSQQEVMHSQEFIRLLDGFGVTMNSILSNFKKKNVLIFFLYAVVGFFRATSFFPNNDTETYYQL